MNSSDTTKKAIVVGVGPIQGLGGQLALRFGKRGHHVYFSGRTQDSLDKVADAIRAEGGIATPIVADATDESDVRELFSQVQSADGTLDLVIYNVGNNTPGRIAEMDAGYFAYSWRVCCFGGFLVGKEAVNAMSESGGTLLFTGASASLRGRAGFGAFNSSKGALRNLAQAMAKECGPDGIHIGHVVVDGGIAGEKILSRYPDYAKRAGAGGLVTLDGIVDAYEFLYDQPRTAWSFEVDLRTSVESW